MLDNFAPRLSTKNDTHVGDYAEANNIELAYVPFQRLLAEPHRGTVHHPSLLRARRHRPPLPRKQGRMIRRYIS
jgi:hypothetical protein